MTVISVQLTLKGIVQRLFHTSAIYNPLKKFKIIIKLCQLLSLTYHKQAGEGAAKLFDTTVYFPYTFFIQCIR